ncbi:MAG TPA: nickel pincer cofactor biosynthesis protein LarB [Chloroflexota bacterium]|nr:nickel pincer cofactor biosynthesis protein LarB [Chloroflexota bacterium]
MDELRLRELLVGVREGAVPVTAALDRLKVLPFEDLGFARLDHHRALRNGFPEVVFCQGKRPEQVTAIVERLAARSHVELGTGASAECYAAVKERVPDSTYRELAQVVVVYRRSKPEAREGILVVTAGTADVPVAEEAVATAELMGNQVEQLCDVGVAGLHRLLDCLETLQRARVIVVVAGMEGALPGVVGGLVSAPVIAVPTSIGYGASFGGIAALLSALNSCASGVATVNIDNGFGGGFMAGLINRLGGPAANRACGSGGEPP